MGPESRQGGLGANVHGGAFAMPGEAMAIGSDSRTDALHSLANSTLKRARLGRISPFIDVEDVRRERLQRD